ncbi:MAG: DNA polymerase III subunit alpha [Cellvibrionales bacterium]|nr:DNA polymerase III subunit alpha [Cellvibrionales bacterium]
MSDPQFVHLRVHSQFSLVDSLISVKDLVKSAVANDMPAIAITDHMNFFGLVKFYKAAIGAGLKPIVGCDVLVRLDGECQPITLLAMNTQGYKNITDIMSDAYLQGQVDGVAAIDSARLFKKHEGVLVLSGGKMGPIGQALMRGNNEKAHILIAQYQQVFGDRFYLELQRTGREQDEPYCQAALALASQFDCPVVATNDVKFIKADDFEAHEARVCIYESEVLDNPKRDKKFSKEQYLRSEAEMCELFADIPEALANSVEIAKRCNVQLHLGEYFLPEYPIPEGMTQETFFRQICREGLDKRLAHLFDTTSADFPATEKEYIERLDFELDIILQMGFPGYFLIVMDFIRWAKDNDVPVGPGRGSGAGSLVAYVLEITDLDPLEYDLLFERFLNPERVSMPDFDIDFCMEGRDKVIAYVADHYGRLAVSQIITFGTMAAKAVVRDVARVQGKPYGLADKLSKMIPFEIGMTLEKAVEQEEVLKDFLAGDADADEIWQMALQLEGTIRGVGKHAGGVVIAPTKLTDFSAVYCDEDGSGLVTQFDKGDVEDAGLVKFDFLGLRTLTIIDWAVKTVDSIRAKSGESPLDMTRIPLDDEETFKLLKKAETTAVFQLESRGMKELIKRLQPDNIEDMIALVALFRPGPLDSGMVDDFVNRKHGRAEVAYPDATYQHEWLKPILEPTYGVIVYQEQVMQIAQVLAGYSLGGADLLRRAMGKKKPEEMEKQRGIFKEGAIGQGVDPELAMKIFDLVEKFAGYGFNKSHSAAYALVSYQTAWLKAHYPAPFMAAVLSSECQNTDKIVTLIDECRSMGLTVLQPDVNTGQFMFTVNDAGEIVYGLGAIKGLGEGPIESLLAAREAKGNFKDLFDFCERVDARKMNKRSLEALIKSGAFDSLGEPRHLLFAAMGDAVKSAEQLSQNQAVGMGDLFDMIDEDTETDPYVNLRSATPWSPKQKLGFEKESLGLFLTGHPIDDYIDELKRLKVKPQAKVQADKKPQVISGMLMGVRYVKTKRGDKMAILTLDDNTGRIDATVFAKTLPDVQDKLIKDDVLVVKGEIENDEFSGGLRMRTISVMTVAEAREQLMNQVVIDVYADQWQQQKKTFDGLIAKHDNLEEAKGCKISFNFHTDDAKGIIHLAEHFRIDLEDDTLMALKNLFGDNQVNFL